MQTEFELLDVGGEGRYENAWNLNPRSLKTLGPDKGVAIPRHILGRAECILLPDRSVRQIIMERAPLRRAAVFEMVRVIVPGGTIILRHHAGSGHNPHVIAHQMIDADFSVQQITIGRQELQQTCFRNVRRVRMTGTTSNRIAIVLVRSSLLTRVDASQAKYPGRVCWLGETVDRLLSEIVVMVASTTVTATMVKPTSEMIGSNTLYS